ncbi:Protein of unknown function DUF761 [Macleaya cordata]|uniref:Uncharacterized protein n=1 Tax=Macleaya cordata TaxID=56857 RepID=A0A200PQG8_MACCD|nr:Protein of unknown function DUF761 [Macleaya cordata]
MKKSSMSQIQSKEKEPTHHPMSHENSNSSSGTNIPVTLIRSRHDHVKGNKPSVREIKIESYDINECAEAFIKRFKQQLRIQRLESIENYEKMLARGL